MPELVRFLGLHCVLGAAFGVVAAAAVIISNVAGLKTLLETSNDPAVALGMLYFMFALTFASLAMGAAVMLLPDKDDDPDDEARN